ncbi:MAG: dodecin family protein [bacterium]|jgi:flavin-binding protein dodecin
MVEKVVELIGTSSNSIEEAVELAISRASVTLSSISEVEITRTTALVEKGCVAGWRVRCNVTFEIENRVHE